LKIKVEPALEGVQIVENIGKEKVEERPELRQTVLKGRACKETEKSRNGRK
jgi:hypothetical protein